MNTPFSDYSKPAYYYRLFHEGRSLLGFWTDDAIRWQQEKAEKIRASKIKSHLSTDFLGSMPHVLPEPPAQSPDGFDHPAFQKAAAHFMQTGEIIRKDGQPLSEAQQEKARALHAKELRMPHTSTVDPLDGVW